VAGLQLLRTRLRPLALAVGLGWAFTSAGCYSWHAEPTLPPPSNVVNQQLRVTLRSGQRRDFADARVVGDSLIGYEPRRAFWLQPHSESLPISEIASLEVRRFSAGRTVAFAVGVALLTVATVQAINGFHWPKSSGCFLCMSF
jgi:hypothetical protein